MGEIKMSENRIDAGQIKETDKQLQYIGEARELITLISERLGRPLLSCIITFGCQMNARDSEKLRGILDAAGFKDTENEDEADMVIYNTCTVRDNADQHVYGRLGHLNAVRKKRPDMIIGLCGCMMQEDHVVAKRFRNFSSEL